MRALWILAMVLSLAAPAFLLPGCQPGEEPVAEEAPPEEPSPAADMAAEEEAIQQAADAFTAAWNNGDAKAIAELFAPDGDSVSPEGELATGREEVEKRYAEDFSETYKGTTISITTTSIRFLEPDVALVDGSYEIAGMKGPEGEEMPVVKGLYLNVCMKEGGQWLIVSLRPMIPVKAPGTT
ncbi:MAG: YybH family protein [Acidobacteriota bacterium]